MNLKGFLYLWTVTCAVLNTAGPASAEIVVLTSGRTLSIKAHREDGDNYVLQMREGGEVTCSKAIVDRIVPDEIPSPEPQLEGPSTRESTTAESDSVPPAPYQEIITSLAEAHGVNPVLVQALIKVESNYRPNARSQRGAMGLMQLMPSTARQYNLRNPYDPKANIAAGIKHLKSLLDRFDGVDLALAAYNAGEGAVKKFNGVPPYRETRAYISRILSLAGLK